MSTEIKGFSLAILSAGLYGTLALVGFQLKAEGLSIEAMLFWRFAAAFVLMASVFPKLVFMVKRIAVKGFILAIIGFWASAFFFFQCANTIGSGLAMSVFFVFPIILGLLNFIFLKETLPLPHKIGMFVSLLALLFLSNFECHTNGNMAVGFLYGLMGGLGYATFIFSTKSTGLPPITLTAWVCLGSAVLFGWHSYISDTLEWLPVANTMLGIPASFIWLVILAVVCTLLPILFFIKAAKLIGNIKTSLLSILEPAITVILGMMFLGEEITWIQAIGLCLMILSLIIVEWRNICGAPGAINKGPDAIKEAA